MSSTTITNFSDLINLLNNSYKGAAEVDQKTIDKIIAYQKGKDTLWTALPSLLIAALGAYKQYDALEKAGDLAEKQAEWVDALRKRQDEIFSKIVLPQHNKADNFFWKDIRGGWTKDIERKVAECGLRKCEYDGDVEEDVTSSIADATQIINQIRLKSKRSTAPFQIGECCDNEYRIAALEAEVMTATSNAARRRFDEKKLRYDTFYWNRYLSVAQMAQNTQQIASNVLVNASTQTQQSLNSQTQLLNVGDESVNSQLSVLGQQANFFGGLSGLGGTLFGANQAGGFNSNLLSLLGNRTGSDGGVLSGTTQGFVDPNPLEGFSSIDGM